MDSDLEASFVEAARLEKFIVDGKIFVVLPNSYESSCYENTSLALARAEEVNVHDIVLMNRRSGKSLSKCFM